MCQGPLATVVGSCGNNCSSSSSGTGMRERPLTYEAVRQRVEQGELLVVVEGRVYNLTKWARAHPGGELAIRHMAGKDATDAMIAFHPQWVFTDRMPLFCIGRIASGALPESPISAAYRRLEAKLHDDGLFDTNYAFYAREIAKFAFLWASMIALVVVFPSSNIACFASALCAAALWHQAAFVAHDAGHSGISHNRIADTLFGITLANVFGGLSIGWWKRSHNVHHIITNDPEHDPDIQHLPFIAVSARFLDNIYSTFYNRTLEFDAIAKIVIPRQHLVFYVVLAFGRFNLYANSWAYVFANSHAVPYRNLEIGGMLIYWSWFTWLLSQLPSWWHILGYVLVSHMVTLFLHLQITLSHFGMSTTESKVLVDGVLVDESFAEKALRTSMDVDCPRWMDWFHGGLQFQVVHHLFPRVPRHNLRRIRPLVQAFAAEHGLTYHSMGFVASNKFVLGALQQVAQQVSAVLSVDPSKLHAH